MHEHVKILPKIHVKMLLEANTNTIKENGTESNQENQEILHKIKFFQPFKNYTQPKKS